MNNIPSVQFSDIAIKQAQRMHALKNKGFRDFLLGRCKGQMEFATEEAAKVYMEGVEEAKDFIKKYPTNPLTL